MNVNISNMCCNNCGKMGHLLNQCKLPIMSIGVIAFRINHNEKNEREIQYLMIMRKETLGYIEFVRGKYSLKNKYYIINLLKQMTKEEKERIKKGDFNLLWNELWGTNNKTNKYKTEEIMSKEKFNTLLKGVYVRNNEKKNDFYNLNELISECEKTQIQWTEPEWGFPKGRRNTNELEYNCAIREFFEETGYAEKKIFTVENLLPFQETFIGSNYKLYKHKYYLMFMEYNDTLNTNCFQKTEVSKMEWKTYEDCIGSIRPYNIEKKRVITNIHNCLKNYYMFVH